MYFQPTTLAEVLQLLQGEKRTLLGGGTDLFPRSKGQLTQYDELIDLSLVKELKKIVEGEGISLGAMVTHQEILLHLGIRGDYQVLAKAAASIGSPQIRARGTIGGNLANASPASDLAPVLIALGAKVQVSSLDQERSFLVEDLFLGPSQTCLKEEEIITKILIPPIEDGTSTFFHKMGRRKALTIAIVNMAILVKMNRERHLKRLRIVVGSVAPIPLRIFLVEERGEGEELTPSLIEELAQIVYQEIRPIDDLRSSAKYRRLLSKELVKEYLFSMIGGFRDGSSNTP